MPAFGESLKPYYPGLLPAEANVWRAWLRSHEGEFDAFRYNVHVGPGVTIPREILTRGDALEAAYAEQYRKATQFKIDVIGLRGNDWWIIEVEDRVNPTAIGQLQTYQVLLPQTVQGVGPTELAVVARTAQPGMLDVADEAGVIVFLVDVPPID